MGETTFTESTNEDTSHVNDGDANYEQEMIKKADAGLGEQAAETLLAGKYKTQEDLDKGVLELLKMKNEGNLESFYEALQKGNVKPESTKDPTVKIPENEKGDKEDNTEDKETSFDFSRYSDEFEADGVLTEESMKELADNGIPEAMVTEYIAGQEALRKANDEHAFGTVGGKENYAAMIEFAKSNLTADEITAFNTGVQVSDLSKREEAINGLFQKYTEANPQFLEGDGSTPSSVGGYATENEFKAAQRDPRYKTDASYRDEVIRKLAASKLV